MPADNLVSRLEGVRERGGNRWIARCPAHGDRSPSLTIRELDDGRVLMHCFGGCEVSNVLAAVGLTFDALYPERVADHHVRGERRPFPAADILRCVAFESLVVSVGAAAVAKGKKQSTEDLDRIILASSRLQRAVEMINAR